MTMQMAVILWSGKPKQSSNDLQPQTHFSAKPS